MFAQLCQFFHFILLGLQVQFGVENHGAQFLIVGLTEGNGIMELRAETIERETLFLTTAFAVFSLIF